MGKDDEIKQQKVLRRLLNLKETKKIAVKSYSYF